MEEEKSTRFKDLGNLAGPVLAFGGVYGNLPALEALKTKAQTLGIPAHNIICTGDVAGYCAQPAACFRLIEEWGIGAIAGNVELQLLAQSDDCGCAFREGSRCDIFSQTWFPFVQAQTTDSIRRQIEALPHTLYFTLGGRRIAVVHGAFGETAAFIFPSTPWETKRKNIEAAGADVVISGHSGLPFVQVSASKCWLNAGAIGMPPNNGSTAVWYSLITPTEGGLKVDLYPLSYDCRQAAAQMREAHLPLPYANTLETGIWDNCEILPPTETAQQGRPLAPESLHALF